MREDLTLPHETSIGFLLHAKDFLVAAELILNRAEGISLPTYFLFARSIELSLKAFLLGCSITPQELKQHRKFGHNLDALLDEAQRHDLKDEVALNQQEVGVIRLLSYDYMEKRLEYRVTAGNYQLPLIEVTEGVARKLVFGLETFCTGSRSN